MKEFVKSITAIFILPMSIFMASCGETSTSGIERIIAQRDSLKEIRAEIDAQIATLDEEISLRDTTLNNKLVTVLSAKSEEFNHYFEVYGNVQSDLAATLYAESSGVIMSIMVNEGQEVKKGQIIIKQDTELIDRNIAEIRTSLDLANSLFEKQKRLWDQNVGSEVQYLEAKNRKESLESTLATLNEQRNKATVRAPYSGIVDKIFPKKGELAGMQTPIARIVNLDELYVTADLTERYLNTIKEGDRVEVIMNRKDTIRSKISRLGKYINPANRTFEVRIDIPKENGKLRPNSLVVVKINDYNVEEALVIPSSLVMQDGMGEDYVYVVKNDEKGRKSASKRKVKTGYSYEGRSVIESGLKEGEMVIEQGARSVRGGDRIEITSI